jgi:hypothetical protein
VSRLLRLQDGESEVGFEYRKQRLCWDDAAGVFKTLKFPDNVSMRLSRCIAAHVPGKATASPAHTSVATCVLCNLYGADPLFAVPGTGNI